MTFPLHSNLLVAHGGGLPDYPRLEGNRVRDQ